MLLSLKLYTLQVQTVKKQKYFQYLYTQLPKTTLLHYEKVQFPQNQGTLLLKQLHLLFQTEKRDESYVMRRGDLLAVASVFKRDRQRKKFLKDCETRRQSVIDNKSSELKAAVKVRKTIFNNIM